jgi:hypothetical protein
VAGQIVGYFERKRAREKMYITQILLPNHRLTDTKKVIN